MRCCVGRKRAGEGWTEKRQRRVGAGSLARTERARDSERAWQSEGECVCGAESVQDSQWKACERAGHRLSQSPPATASDAPFSSPTDVTLTHKPPTSSSSHTPTLDPAHSVAHPDCPRPRPDACSHCPAQCPTPRRRPQTTRASRRRHIETPPPRAHRATYVSLFCCFPGYEIIPPPRASVPCLPLAIATSASHSSAASHSSIRLFAPALLDTRHTRHTHTTNLGWPYHIPPSLLLRSPHQPHLSPRLYRPSNLDWKRC